MINPEAMFHVSYGLYVICSGDKDLGNGYISNTFFQVTAQPPQFATCCNKDNYTAELIRNSGAFSASVLHQETKTKVFGRFGYKSGKDFDKFADVKIEYGETGVPIYAEDVIGWMECRVIQTVDVGTHLIFIGELLHSEVLNDSIDPMTYLYYKNVKKGVAPKNAPTYVDPSKIVAPKESPKAAKYKCAACGYIYDDAVEKIKFDDLPDNWVCPLCGSEKDDFYKL